MNNSPLSEYEMLRTRIFTFMIQRDWKSKLAKLGEFEQSLLEHSINCLDVMLTFLPILRVQLRLSEEEEQALILGIAIHDVAKERDDWQDYIRGMGNYKSHIVPEYTAHAVDELAAWLGFTGQRTAQATADLHMKSVQTAARIFTATQDAGPRVMLLQRLVDAVDNIASANGLLAARDALARSPLDKYVYVAYHSVHIRGISTTLLHQAAQITFENNGWLPLLFYPTGTLYIRPGTDEIQPIDAKMVSVELRALLKQVMEAQVQVLPSLTVGSIIQTFLPKPDIFDYRWLDRYLREATKRAGRKPGSKLNASNAWKYVNMRHLLDATGDVATTKRAHTSNAASILENVSEDYHHLLLTTPSDLPETEALDCLDRMGEAHPEMAVFKFFREATKLMDEDGLSITQRTYNQLFGPIAFDALTSTSTLMPAQDQVFSIDFFWALPLETLADFLDMPELNQDGTVGLLEQKRRVQLLIKTLGKIGEIGFAAMEQPPSVDTFAAEVAAVLVEDFVMPSLSTDNVQDQAAHQLSHYKQAKYNIRTTRETAHLCPACNRPFVQAKQALADYLDKPGGFTGRKFPYDRDDLTVCQACYYERLLRQILLGRKAYDLIVLLPRMSLGYFGGKVLMDKLSKIRRGIKAISTADTVDPDETLRLDMAWYVARQALAADFSQMTVEDLLSLFTYRPKEDTIKKNHKKVTKAIQEALRDETLESACLLWEREFADWDTLARAITYKELDDDEAQAIRESVYGLRPPIEFIAQTPNLVLAPSSNPRVSDSSALADDKDSDTKAALKQLLITLIFALGLECSVAILSDAESLDALMLDSNGLAYVPPLSSVRDLVANSRSLVDQQRRNPAWLSQSEAPRWLRALASAMLLASKAEYPPRNDIYQILTARSKGALLRRIEQKGGRMFSEDWQQLEAIGEVLS
jgi:hypothetical protein